MYARRISFVEPESVYEEACLSIVASLTSNSTVRSSMSMLQSVAMH